MEVSNSNGSRDQEGKEVNEASLATEDRNLQYTLCLKEIAHFIAQIFWFFQRSEKFGLLNDGN